MKRFVLFAWDYYEIGGALDDYVGTFEALDAAKAAKGDYDQASIAVIGTDGTLTTAAEWHRAVRGETQREWAQRISDEQIEKLCGTWIDRSRIIQPDGTPTEWYDPDFS